jgi:ribose 5-phosphate isomerase A
VSGPGDAGMNPKQAAAERAATLVESGMRVGLGTGSTAAFLVAALGRRVREGLDIVAVPTSEATRRQALELGIRLTDLDDTPELDLTIDGADELDGDLRLIKGGGGALLREKIVAAASHRMVVIADSSKQVETLGAFPLPVEIVPFGIDTTLQRIHAVLQQLGALPEADAGDRLRLRRRADGAVFMTDGAHVIVDLHLGRIADPTGTAAALKAVTGVVDHGLFIGLASDALIGTPSGVMEVTRPPTGR